MIEIDIDPGTGDIDIDIITDSIDITIIIIALIPHLTRLQHRTQHDTDRSSRSSSSQPATLAVKVSRDCRLGCVGVARTSMAVLCAV